MAVSGSKYNKAMEFIGKGIVDFDTNVFKVALIKNTYALDPAHEQFTTSLQSHELAPGNGYTAGGVTLTGVTWAYNAGISKTVFDCADPSWMATGGDLGPAYGAVFYDSTSDKVLAFVDFGQATTAGNGTELKININAAGLLRFT